MKRFSVVLSTQVEDGVRKASAVMQNVAAWLHNKNLGMWSLEELTPENLLVKYGASEIYLGFMDEDPCLAFVLQWEDPFFWPEADPEEAGYVHKLSVSRKYRGMGLAERALEWCKTISRERGKNYLRLDCDPARAGLVSLYERSGFTRVGRRMMGPYDTAFYEYALEKEVNAA